MDGIMDESKDRGDDKSEHSFLDLMTAFSKLDMSRTTEVSGETCPLCQEAGLSLQAFVPHVYNCIRRLDIDEDKKYAEKVSKEWNGEYGDDDDRDDRSFLSSAACKYGASCDRQDVGHFQNVYHPPSTCPCCNNEFAMYEINEHLNSCLNTTSSASSSVPSCASSPPTASYGGGDGCVGGGGKRGEGEETSMLTKDQLIAISSIIVKKSAGESDGDEPSILEMLETFGKLGFTKENLQKEFEN